MARIKKSYSENECKPTQAIYKIISCGVSVRHFRQDASQIVNVAAPKHVNTMSTSLFVLCPL